MIIRIDYPEAASRLDLWGGVSGTFAGVDRFNRVIDQRWTSTSSVESQNNVPTTPADIDRYQYGYDRDSNRVWKKNVVADAASVPLDEYYTYDALNRLATMQRGTLNGTNTGITGTPALEQDWTLDPTGNWRGFVNKTAGTTDLNQARGANPVNEITSISATTGPAWVTPAYDAAGNTTTFPQPDPTRGFTATYDAWNRMTAVSDGTTPVAKYAYDGRNRRVVSQSYTGGTLTETRHAYYTSGWQNIEERLGTATTPDTQHVWGLRYIDELVCRDDATPRRIYACQDANFNVTALIGTSGSVLQRFVYEPYGGDSVRTATWEPTSERYLWTFRYTACELEYRSGTYDLRNRWRHLALGGFLSRDPIGAAAVGSNLYAYAQLAPTLFSDPSGLIPFDCACGCLLPVPPEGYRAINISVVGDCVCTYHGPADFNEMLGFVMRLSAAIAACCKEVCDEEAFNIMQMQMPSGNLMIPCLIAFMVQAYGEDAAECECEKGDPKTKIPKQKPILPIMRLPPGMKR